MLGERAEQQRRRKKFLQQNDKAKAPSTAPCSLPMPPRITIISTVPDWCQARISGLTKPNWQAAR